MVEREERGDATVTTEESAAASKGSDMRRLTAGMAWNGWNELFASNRLTLVKENAPWDEASAADRSLL